MGNKRIITVLAVVGMVVAFTGCGSQDNTVSNIDTEEVAAEAVDLPEWMDRYYESENVSYAMVETDYWKKPVVIKKLKIEEDNSFNYYFEDPTDTSVDLGCFSGIYDDNNHFYIKVINDKLCIAAMERDGGVDHDVLSMSIIDKSDDPSKDIRYTYYGDMDSPFEYNSMCGEVASTFSYESTHDPEVTNFGLTITKDIAENGFDSWYDISKNITLYSNPAEAYQAMTENSAALSKALASQTAS